ncbi:hypothetical protein Tco_1233373, partial [Tanacetum coccineum]
LGRDLSKLESSFFYDYDDNDYTIIYSKPKAITPDLPIEEPDNSLSMGDEHLDTISSVEILVPIPSEFEGISKDTCDVSVCENPSTFDALNDHSEILSDSNDDDTSSDDNDFEGEILEKSYLNILIVQVGIVLLSTTMTMMSILLYIASSKAITPDLSIEEPDNSLNIGDEHLDTIPSIENLVPIPSEFKGISEYTCDVPICEDPSTFDSLSNHSEILSDSNNDGTSSDDDSYENIKYVEASPLNLEIISLEEVNDVDQ